MLTDTQKFKATEIAQTLAAMVAEKGLRPKNLTPEMIESLMREMLADRAAFVAELRDNKTNKARIVRGALARDVWTQIRGE